MIQTVKRMLSRSTQEPVIECRNCGANRVCLLGKDGRLQRDDRTREVLTDRACLERNGIDAPAVVKLFSRVGYEPVPVDFGEAARILDEQLGLRERAHASRNE